MLWTASVWRDSVVGPWGMAREWPAWEHCHVRGTGAGTATNEGGRKEKVGCCGVCSVDERPVGAPGAGVFRDTAAEGGQGARRWRAPSRHGVISLEGRHYDHFMTILRD